jgi:hypothetical protein
MESRKEHNFRKLIQKAGAEKPSSEFSAILMQKIHAEAEINAVQDLSLEYLLKSQTPLANPSQAFSQQVMNSVLDPQPVKEPKIISSFAWYLIAAAFVIIASYTISSGPSPGIDQPSIFATLLKKASGVPSVYPLTIFAGSILVLIDYLLRQKVRSFKD